MVDDLDKYFFVFVLLAGGDSQRFGLKKELITLKDGKSSLLRLHEIVSKTLFIRHLHVVYHPCYFSQIHEQLSCFGQIQTTYSQAGITRQESVYFALDALRSVTPDFVLVHDGARPWLSEQIIRTLCVKVAKKKAVVPCVALVDSLKKVSQNFEILEHCSRDRFVLAQTPQAFEFQTLLHAHEYAKNQKMVYTDDAEVWSCYSSDPVFMVTGEIQNKKITFKEDLL